jgi:hypothetical protein
MTNDQFGALSGDPAGPGDEGEAPELSERFLAGMELARTPEQQEIARQIYQRLKDGDDVDDVKPLIEEMMRVVVTQRNGGRVRGEEPTEQRSAGIMGGVGQRQGAWGASRDNGLAGDADRTDSYRDR